MATLMLAAFLLLGEPNPAHTPHEPLGRSPFRMRTIRSLRLRHTTLRSGLPSSRKAPTPAVRCASLSTCCPAWRHSLGTAAAALPLHPFHLAARSTSGVAP